MLSSSWSLDPPFCQVPFAQTLVHIHTHKQSLAAGPKISPYQLLTPRSSSVFLVGGLKCLVAPSELKSLSCWLNLLGVMPRPQADHSPLIALRVA